MSKKRKHEANVVKIGGKTISLEGYLTKKPRQETNTKDASANTARASQPPETASQNASNTSENMVKASEPPDDAFQNAGDASSNLKQASQKASRASSNTAKPMGDPKYLATRQALPIWKYQDDIRRVLRANDVLVLVG
ncbi:hypothetical protein B0T14DRAFT_503976, partial [Immersiella caudata]